MPSDVRALPSVEPADTTLVNVSDYVSGIVLDMKYASEENFLKEKVYDCAECYLRYATVKALLKAQSQAGRYGYKLRVFDCYRPHSVQKKMWKLVPNPDYVADPAKGSIHNRGGALDLTLCDSIGVPLDMGTAFDHFGPEASPSYTQFSEDVLENRRKLRRIMKKAGFRQLPSEWWHFNLKGARELPISDFRWPCP
ncbi:MAG TPA: D-alanyl-D-alanine dipeptidase [Flavobacterium sp.]|nr:D-alanyl-D-alanine dipeptidase [Flavobacterium sp.]